MKKILLFTIAVILAFSLSLSAYAEEEPIPPTDTSEVVEIPPLEENTKEENQNNEVTNSEIPESPEADVQGTVPDTNTVEVVDREKSAEQFISYIFSGEDGADELMKKIVAIGEQYQQSKERGYTFKERLVQMFTTENLVVLSAAGFLVICGVAFFFIEAKRKKDRIFTATYIAKLEKKYSEEVKSNKQMKETLLQQGDEIADMKMQLVALCDASEANKLDLDKSTRANLAVAKMVKDVFLNSRTIDANAKSLLIHNYLEVIEGDTIEETNGDE